MKLKWRIIAVSIAILFFVMWIVLSSRYLPTSLQYFQLAASILFIVLVWYAGGKYEHAKTIAISDPLTQVYNRHFVYEFIPKFLVRIRKNPSPFSIVIVDVNDLKIINDTEGHDKGDEVIRNLSNLLKHNIRKSDILARWGGDEFLIISPNAETSDMESLMERIQSLCETLNFSYGIATYPYDGVDFEELIKIADGRMYEMKNTTDALLQK